jgi:hypothetical protein
MIGQKPAEDQDIALVDGKGARSVAAGGRR